MLTAAELAADLGISTRQVQRLVSAGMPVLPVGVRAVRYDADACRAWLQANQEAIASCLSTARPKAATKSLSASAAAEFTAACRRAQLRVMPSESSLN